MVLVSVVPGTAVPGGMVRTRVVLVPGGTGTSYPQGHSTISYLCKYYVPDWYTSCPRGYEPYPRYQAGTSLLPAAEQPTDKLTKEHTKVSPDAAHQPLRFSTSFDCLALDTCYVRYSKSK
jgi:hypothetical protein